jgi:hypothetical protein
MGGCDFLGAFCTATMRTSGSEKKGFAFKLDWEQA